MLTASSGGNTEDDDLHHLKINFTSKKLIPDITGGDVDGDGGRRRGNRRIGPISVPGHIAIGMSNHNLNIFERRSKNMFGSCRGNALGMSARNDLWGTQAFLSATHAQDGDYRMETPTVAFGYDRRLSRRTFVGIGAALGWPDFSSERTRIKADDSTLALYGGTKTRSGIELTGRAGLGSTSYRQTRNVRDEYHASRFGSHSFFTGLGVSKLLSTGSPGFCLRPGVNYDYIRLMMDGFHEDGGGLYALHFDKYSQDLHRLKIGLDVNWQPRRWFNATGEIFYLGMYARSPQTRAHLVNDPVNGFTTVGTQIDQNNLGLQLHLPLNRWELGAGYTALFARDTASQQATLNAVYRF